MKKISKIAAFVLAVAMAVTTALPVFAAPSKGTSDVTSDNVNFGAFQDVGNLTVDTTNPSDPAKGQLAVVQIPTASASTIKDIQKAALDYAIVNAGAGSAITGVTVHKAFQLQVTGSAVIPADGIHFTLNGLALPNEDLFLMKQDANGNWINMGKITGSTSISSVFKNANDTMVIVGFTKRATDGSVAPTAPQTGMSFPIAAVVAGMTLCAAAFCLKKSRA